jgi:heme exporter protein D
MNWDSPAEFFAMGGDGFFVWGSYAVCLLCMLAEPVLAARRRRRALQAARQDERNLRAAGRNEEPENDEEDER